MKTSPLSPRMLVDDGGEVMSSAEGRPSANAEWWVLPTIVLAVAVQACGGGGQAVAPRSDASPAQRDADQGNAPDAAPPRWPDASSGVDTTSTTAGQDAGTAAARDAADDEDSPASERDTAENELLGTRDGAGEASPAIDSSEMATMDADDDVSSVSPFCSTWDARDSGVMQQTCLDFSDPAASAAFTPEAGTWTVSRGSYDARGPSEQVVCPGGADGGSGMTASLLAGVSAQDVRIHAKLTSMVSPDKVLVLRSRPGGNRIELNFLANYTYEGEERGGAMHVSELVNCVNTTYVDANASVKEVQIAHAIGQPIVVDLRLVGTRLTVVVDGKQVFDRTLPVSTTTGSVGFAVFREAETQFDDFLVDVLK